MPVSLVEHAAEAAEHGVPPEVIDLLTYLFSEVVDGRNASTTGGVRRALGREPRDFRDYHGGELQCRAAHPRAHPRTGGPTAAASCRRSTSRRSSASSP